jgi:dipeptidyl aminopeptidase/acylaminoacyl peptidase
MKSTSVEKHGALLGRLVPTLIFSSLCGGALLAAASSEPHLLTLNDLLAVEPIAETHLSPDGKTFAFVRAGQILTMPADGGWPVSLTSSAGGKTAVSWSPNGGMLAYASQGNIWTVSSVGGQPKRLTHSLPGPGDPRQAGDRNPHWSPKGDWILFESGRRGHSDLLTVSPDGLSENILTASSADSGEAEWSPDGSEIAYIERAPGYFSGKLQLAKFDSQTGRAKSPVTLYTSPEDRGGGWSVPAPVWSPDGKTLAVVLQESGWDNIYLLPTAGGAPKPLTRGEQDDSNPVFSPDGKSIAFTSNREKPEESRIWIMPMTGGERAHPLAAFKVPGVESEPEWSSDNKQIYFHRTSPLTSTDLLVANASESSEPKSLTNTTPKNVAAGLEAPDRVQFKSKDGTQITGLLYKPHGLKTDTRYPAVLWIHGGPEAQDVYRLDLWAQYLAQQGYLVLEPNYRGSTGYGEKFRNANVEDSGGGEMNDVAAGAQYLIDRGLADPKRIAIGGGSHGGTMTAYAVTRYPQLFAAAIEMFGVVDRATFVERTNGNSALRWMMKMGGSPAEKPEAYQRANSLLLVDKIQTPLLILHGEDDPQVPPYESVQFTKALAAHHKTYYYFTYPGELHGFSQRDHRLDAWAKELAFLEAYINPKFGQSSTSTDPFQLTGPTRVANEHPAR